MRTTILVGLLLLQGSGCSELFGRWHGPDNGDMSSPGPPMGCDIKSPVGCAKGEFCPIKDKIKDLNGRKPDFYGIDGKCDQAWAVSPGSPGDVLIAHWDGASWNVEYEKRAGDVWVNPYTGRAWAVGLDRILGRNDGGVWEPTAGLAARVLNSISGVAKGQHNEDIWVSGADAFVCTRPDICTPDSVAAAIGKESYGIWADEQGVWITTLSSGAMDWGRIFHRTLAGSWEEVYKPAIETTLYRIRKIGRYYWAVGVLTASGKPLILRSDGGLNGSWIPEMLPAMASGSVDGIWGISEDDIWAVGQGGLVLHRSKEGWGDKPVVSGVTTQLRAVWGNGIDRIFVGGKDTLLVHCIKESCP